MSLKVDSTTKSAELASGFTVEDYDHAVKTHNRDVIAEAIHRRFSERYLAPVSDPAAKRHGFTMMAIACLMIEALQSFRRGWLDTSQRGQVNFVLARWYHIVNFAGSGHKRAFATVPKMYPKFGN